MTLSLHFLHSGLLRFSRRMFSKNLNYFPVNLVFDKNMAGEWTAARHSTRFLSVLSMFKGTVNGFETENSKQGLYLKTQSSAPPGTQLIVLVGLFCALAHLAEKKVIHRDALGWLN